MWVIAGSDVAGIDVATSKVTPLGLVGYGSLDNLAVTPTAIWVADFSADKVLKIDPATGKIVDNINTGAPEGVLSVGGAIWVTNHHEGSVTRLDATTDKPIGTVVVGLRDSGGPQELVEGAGSVWTDESNTSEVIRMDPATGAVQAHILMPGDFVPCGGIAASAAAVWVTGCHETNTMVRIDPTTNAVVADIRLGNFSQDPLVIDGFLWVAVGGDGDRHELERINPTTNLVDRVLRLDALVDVGGASVARGDYLNANSTKTVLRVPLSHLTPP